MRALTQPAATQPASRAARAPPAHESLVGRRVRKLFGKEGWFGGEVVSSRVCPQSHQRYFYIVYEDDDQEEITRAALLQILVPEGGQGAPYEDDTAAEAAAQRAPDVLEYALLEAVSALRGAERSTHKRAVTEYAYGLLSPAARAAEHAWSALDAPLQRVVRRGWATEEAAPRHFQATVRSDGAKLRAATARHFLAFARILFSICFLLIMLHSLFVLD